MDVTKAIQILVARADMIICTICYHLPELLIAFAVGYIVGKAVLKCLPKK